MRVGVRVTLYSCTSKLFYVMCKALSDELFCIRTGLVRTRKVTSQYYQNFYGISLKIFR